MVWGTSEVSWFVHRLFGIHDDLAEETDRPGPTRPTHRHHRTAQPGSAKAVILTPTNFKERLDQLQSVDRMEQPVGGVHFVGLDQVRSRVGEKWPHLADRIHRVVGRIIEQHLHPSDLCCRYDDLTYVLVFGDRDPAVAEETCHAITQEIISRLFEPLNEDGVPGTLTATSAMELLPPGPVEPGIACLDSMVDRLARKAGAPRPASARGPAAAGPEWEEMRQAAARSNQPETDLAAAAASRRHADLVERPARGPAAAGPKWEEMRQAAARSNQPETDLVATAAASRRHADLVERPARGPAAADPKWEEMRRAAARSGQPETDRVATAAASRRHADLVECPARGPAAADPKWEEMRRAAARSDQPETDRVATAAASRRHADLVECPARGPAAADPEWEEMRRAAARSGQPETDLVATAAASHRHADLELGYRPIWDARRGAIYMLLARPGGSRWIDLMFKGHPVTIDDTNTRMIAETCYHILERAANDLKHSVARDHKCLVTLPVHYDAIHSDSLVQAYLTHARRIPSKLREMICVELIGAPHGLPCNRLFDLVTSLRLLFRGVMRRTGLDHTDFRAPGEIGVLAYGVDVQPVAEPERDQIRQFDRYCAAATRFNAKTYLHGLRTGSLTTAAIAAGFTFINGDFVADRVRKPEVAYRLSLPDLYRSALRRARAKAAPPRLHGRLSAGQPLSGGTTAPPQAAGGTQEQDPPWPGSW